MGNVYIEIIIITALILLNGFFAMSEMAIVSARRVRLLARVEAGDKKAEVAIHLSENPELFFSTIQIGITLIGILTGVFGGATLVDKIKNSLVQFPAIAQYSDSLAVSLVVMIITYFTLIFGELVPKKLAFSNPEAFACASAPMMNVLMRFSLPVVKMLSLSTQCAVRLLGFKQPDDAAITEDEIVEIIKEGARAGAIENSEKEMLERIIRLGNRQVGAIMTHKSKVIWLDLDDPWEISLEKMCNSPYSIYPVANKDFANMTGLVKAKNFFAASRERTKAELLGHIVQPLYAQETLRVTGLLELFKQQPNLHFAIIIDEIGDPQGIVTLNDILESIVGDIASGSEGLKPQFVQREDGSILMDGSFPVDEALELLKIKPHKRVTYHTIAGFMLSNMKVIPKAGAYFDKYGYRFEVVDMDDKRIDSVLITRLARQH